MHFYHIHIQGIYKSWLEDFVFVSQSFCKIMLNYWILLIKLMYKLHQFRQFVTFYCLRPFDKRLPALGIAQLANKQKLF